MISLKYSGHIQEIASCFCMFFFYFLSLLVTFFFYISQLKFESYHRYMTGRPERIMLPRDVNKRKSAKLLDSPVEFFFASIYARCKKKSKDEILISSPVFIFFDKSFLVSSPNKTLAIKLSESNLRALCNALK